MGVTEETEKIKENSAELFQNNSAEAENPKSDSLKKDQRELTKKNRNENPDGIKGKNQPPKDSGSYKERLKEITAVLHKHAITRGVSPEKLRLILTDLGPTFIKLGQIMSMRSDILPKRYCDELMKLCSDVDPMPFSEVEEVLQEAFGCPWQEEFQEINPQPLGSASIAQVHRAVLKTGEEVVVKVQRKGIYEIMARDIGLMKKAVKLLPPVSIKEAVDLNLVLEELWRVTQEEMNFLTEAANMEEFSRKNKNVAFVKTPILYREYTTANVLTMEYIDGIPIDDKETLLADGYDLEEIGSKFVDNFIKQVMDDGFFHADPHPGNVMIQGGRIVWIDMGMMGRLNDRDRELIGQAIEGVALNDIGKIQDAVLALGEFKGKPDQSRLYTDIRDLMAKYGTADFGEIDIVEILTDLMDVMKENKIVMPHGLTMLARGLTHMEGVLANICPEINMVQIAAARLKSNLLEESSWKKQLKGTGKKLYRSMLRAVDIPALAADFLQGCMKGQTNINLDLHASDDLAWLMRRLIRNIVLGLWVMALLISSSIICTTDMNPKILGIPALGALGYFGALVILMYLFIKHFMKK